MDYAKKIVYQSNYWYNDGLRKAQDRDMSGAIASLKTSLQFNRENIAARNLLGLVYYGIGEVPEALVQWIISKNLHKTDNIAEYYIRKVQSDSGQLDTINQAIKKYNQCVGYCRQHGEDLAIIQLRQVIDAHPSFLKAYQLLGLLYMQTDQLTRARQLFKTARKLDMNNETTLRYMHELTRTRGRKVRRDERKKRTDGRKRRTDSVEYNMGNETIIQPRHSAIMRLTEHFAVANLFIGAAIGAAIIWFLVAPAVNQYQSDHLNDQMRSYSERITALQAQISAQTRTLDEYRKTAEDAEEDSRKAALTAESYENLLKVIEQYNSRQYNDATMSQSLLIVNRDALSANGQTQYDALAAKIFPNACASLYSGAIQYVNAANYQNAIDNLNLVLQMDETYKDGGVAYYLGRAYSGIEDYENAEKWLKVVLESYEDSSFADEAEKLLEEIGASVKPPKDGSAEEPEE